MLIVSLFEPIGSLILGSLMGFVFGFLLRKAYVSRFDTIVKQLILKDFTVMKVIFTAIIVGSIGIYFMKIFGWVALDLSKASFLAVIFGGTIFGIGMAITGYCPGTAIASLADGSKDMIYGISGMLFGSYFYAFSYPFLSNIFTISSTEYQKTIPMSSNISEWLVIAFLIVFAIVFFYFIEKKVEKKDIKAINSEA